MVGLFLSLMVTRGLAPVPWLVGPLRRVLDLLRAIPEIVIALVLIFLLGGGPVPAMIAIALHTIGALGKLFSEVNENASLKPVEGLASVGAGWSQRMWLGVIPQVAPNYISYALLRFEINIRASAILGFVGAGGIGYDLRNTMSWGQGKFDEEHHRFCRADYPRADRHRSGLSGAHKLVLTTNHYLRLAQLCHKKPMRYNIHPCNISDEVNRQKNVGVAAISAAVSFG